MNNKRLENIEALEINLHNHRVGILVSYQGGRNILSFDPAYVNGHQANMTYSLRQLSYPAWNKPHITQQRLSPVLSNLLPEGALRQWIISQLKIASDNEFPILAWTGKDLPGALVARPLKGVIPNWALSSRECVKPISIPITHQAHHFSLAGVQMKFSSNLKNGVFKIMDTAQQESWIIKPPDHRFRGVPENEYTAMKLAEMIGVNIPEIRLVDRKQITNMPDINLPDEQFAYAIKRFDRNSGDKVHMEDFAQIFNFYPHRKYEKGNYEQIAKTLMYYSPRGTEDIQQMARRLLANILLGNADAHLKNWSVFYPDKRNPVLSPAYDIVSTFLYIETDQGAALNMGKKKNWGEISLETFQYWAKRIEISWPAIRAHLVDAISFARESWPKKLKDMPLLPDHKKRLIEHWRSLSDDFKINDKLPTNYQ